MRVALIAWLSLFAVVAHAWQETAFRAATDLVLLDVLVARNGVPVDGLGSGDFEVRDNGVVQPLTFVRLEESSLTMSLVLDVSRSVSSDSFAMLRDAVTQVRTMSRADDRLNLFTFDRGVYERDLAWLTAANVEDARTAQTTSAMSAGSALRDAAFAALTTVSAPGERALVLIFSDGLDTSSWLSTDQVIDAAKRANATVYAVTHGRRKSEFLAELTSVTGGRHIEIEAPREWGRRLSEVFQEYRLRYLVGYVPQASTPGWHRLDVRVRRPGAQVRARRGYQIGAAATSTSR